MRKEWWIFFNMILLLSCNTIDSTIEITHDKVGYIIVPLVINGIEIDGIFDTGSVASTLSAKDVDKVGLKFSSDSVYTWFPYLQEKPILSKIGKNTHVKIGKLRSEEAIAFSVPANNTLTIIGTDIIHQFNWLFDFENGNLVVSSKELAFDFNNSVKIPFEYKDGTMISSVSFKDIIIDHLMIDTGLPQVLFQDGSTTSIYLRLAKSLMNKQKIVVNKENESSKTDSIRLTSVKKIPFENDSINHSNIPIFKGVFTLSDRKKHHDFSSINGAIALCYAREYSQMYIDMKNNTVYLKP